MKSAEASSSQTKAGCIKGPKASLHQLPNPSLLRAWRLYRWVILSVSGSALAFGASGLPAMAQTAQGPADTGAPVVNATLVDLAASSPAQPVVSAPKRELKSEVGVSGDFMMGQGQVTLPIGFAINNAYPNTSLKPEVLSADRSSEYFGGTASYSYGRSWYFDLSYEQGVSTGTQRFQIANTAINGAMPGTIPASFSYDDNWYQFYIRYNFSQWLKGSRFKAYMRLGVTMVQATLTAQDSSGLNIYRQNDDTTDYMGNLGFGLRYSVYSTLRFKVGLQAECEGFYGQRTQDSTESLPIDPGLAPGHATIDNNLYGGIGRGTLHAEWLLGHSGRFKIFGDAGLQYKYTAIDYPSGASAPNEELWGPYVKIGCSYVF